MNDPDPKVVCEGDCEECGCETPCDQCEGAFCDCEEDDAR